jgi:hypothetical protein
VLDPVVGGLRILGLNDLDQSAGELAAAAGGDAGEVRREEPGGSKVASTMAGGSSCARSFKGLTKLSTSFGSLRLRAVATAASAAGMNGI